MSVHSVVSGGNVVCGDGGGDFVVVVVGVVLDVGGVSDDGSVHGGIGGAFDGGDVGGSVGDVRGQWRHWW